MSPTHLSTSKEKIKELMKVTSGAAPADLAIINGDVVNVYTGEIQKGNTVLIKGDTIAYVGKDGDSSIGQSTEVIDATGKTLIPGLIDGHTHIDDMFPIGELVKYALKGSTTTIITETSAIASYAQASRFINALKDLGCMFALDDFGTGLSSFGYLKHFPVDFLKIDGSFVKEILHDPIDREMVRSINEIGHLTNKKTIAEFAENQEIITMLRGMGVDYAQGYGVSEPKRIQRVVNA